MPPYASRSELWEGSLEQEFCAYCGRPPRGAWRERRHRVCSHCKLGMVLRTIPDAAPGLNDPFLIVDEQLTVQAISRHAETVLMVDEPTGVGAPLDQFLIADGDDSSAPELTKIIALVRNGNQVAELPALRTVGEPQLRFQAKVSSCGPPLAALLVLKPLQVLDSASPEGRGGTKANGAGAPD